MQQDIENVVNKFIDKTKGYAKSIEKEAKVIKQYNKNRDNGYKTISSVIELDGFKVRFEYHVNEGIGFKKGIVTVFYNIGNLEYHAYDVLKQIAPKDTGQLRNSITSKVERDGTDVVGVVFTPKEYAPYVEYGTGLFAEKGGRKDVPWVYVDDKGKGHTTSGQKPHPYLRPALNENRDKIIRILEESVKND